MTAPMRCLKSLFIGFTLLAASALFDARPAAAQYLGIGPFGVYLGGHRHYGGGYYHHRSYHRGYYHHQRHSSYRYGHRHHGGGGHRHQSGGHGHHGGSAPMSPL